MYSVKNKVSSSHVSHSISHNYSYIKNSTVFVSNGFEVINHTQPNRSPSAANDEIANQASSSHQFHDPSSKDRFPITPTLDIPLKTKQPKHFTSSTSNDSDRVTHQSILPDSVVQSEYFFASLF